MIQVIRTLCLILLWNLGTSSCNHPIFCSDEILAAVSNSNIFEDSKSFVDLNLRVPIDKALSLFKTVPIRNFLQQCFIQAQDMLKPTKLIDFNENPTSIQKIKNQKLREMALDLNQRWNQLARKVNLNLLQSTCKDNCTSFIPQMNNRTIIIPGGRFRQSYYWDSFWIVKGLIACQMIFSAQLVVKNFILMIQKYGYVPNGFRVYYLNRSQPPFLALMVRDVSDAYRKIGKNKEATLLQQFSFKSLLVEHQYWMTTHSVSFKLNDKHILLNVYNANTSKPRPQGYKEDIIAAQKLAEQNRPAFYKSISSMAESGWDFSSRWFLQSSRIQTTCINQIVPSDLNTILGLVENYLSELSIKFGRLDLEIHFKKIQKNRMEYFQSIKRQDYFPDSFLFEKPTHRDWYPSDLYPHLLFNTRITNPYKDKVNPATSQTKTGQQWDMPNVWAPNNWILHQVLEMQEKIEVAKEWVSTVYCSWKNEGAIYQKYRNDIFGKRGEGGEYTVQTGFGWSNGLVLEYLIKYGDILTDPICI